ncbi:MAG: hypothetical protein JXR37_03625 [Kiritimatiellae bacterium]|nr:hypothetical protein [Kiritimatiellia bacterium]
MTDATQQVIHVRGPAEAIRPYAANPMYWQYKGKPVLLLGGSDRDNLFHWAGEDGRLAAHLDTLRACGGNYVRCTISSREYTPDGYRWDVLPYPFKRLDDGRYDLDQWDEAYWGRLRSFLAATHTRGIIAQVEVWDMWNEAGHSDQPGNGWYCSPWNPNNNVNYAWSDTLSLKPGRTAFYNGFHHAPVSQDRVLLARQCRFVGRLVDECLAYDHVLFQLDNESGIDFAVGRYWATFIRDRARAQGRAAYVCDSRRFHQPAPCVTTEFRDWHNPEIQVPVANPDVYTFCDISQNNGNGGQAQYDNLVWYRARVLEHGARPINHTKCYHFNWPTGADFGSGRVSPSDAEASAKMWRAIFGGAASIRFHRHTPFSPAGLREGFGLGTTAQTHIRSARLFTDAACVFGMAPAPARLTAREENEAYAMAAPGERYAVFFTGEGDRAVELDLQDACGVLRERWLNIGASRWEAERAAEAGGRHKLTAPGPGQWAVLLQRD